MVMWLFLTACDSVGPSAPKAPSPCASTEFAAAGHDEVPTCLPCLADLPASLLDGGNAHADRVIVVYKRQKLTALYEHGALAQCTRVELGDWPYEPKVQQDGESTPEGWYSVATKRTSAAYDWFPATVFTEALHVSYPNAADVDRAVAQGVVTPEVASRLREQIGRGELPDQETKMGGQILLHDWNPGVPTAGCVGLPAEEMHALFTRAVEGDPVLILPWRTVLYNDGSTAEAAIPPRPPPSFMPSSMIDRERSRPGRMVLNPIEITADGP